MPTTVRRAREADVDAACAVLADAFADYPWTRWTVDERGHGDRIEALQRLFMERVVLPYGEVWVAVDEHDAIVSVASWSLPHVEVPAAVFDGIAAAQSELEGSRHDAAVAAEAHVASLRPTIAHYYLGAVGTRRARQRHGLASAVLAPVLDRARTERTAVYLETSAFANVSFYERLGFVTVDESTVAGGGPKVWAMLRPGP